jgi:hypothetical protein
MTLLDIIITSAATLVVGLILLIFEYRTSWFQQHLLRRTATAQETSASQESRDVRQMFDDLSNAELRYLGQFLRHSSTLIAFDDADPVAGLLEEKGLIYREVSLDPVPSFNVRHSIGETFRILPWVYQYLSDHRQLFKKLSQQPEAD